MATNWWIALLIALLMRTGTAFAQHAKPRAHDQVAPTQVPLSMVAAQVVKTLDTFNAQAGSHNLPKLSRVTFDFNVTEAQAVGFSFNILIFKLGANRETSTTNEVAFTYSVPASPAGTGLTPHTQPAAHDFSQSLLDLLTAAAAQVKQTQSVGPARFSNLTLTLGYGAVWDTSGGAAGSLSLVTLDGTVDRKRSDVQTLILYFSQ